jgi:methyl-accepting chemotaxis protein
MQEKYAPKFLLRPRSKLKRTIARYWKQGLYSRVYKNLSANNSIKTPTNEQAKRIHEKMRKFSEKDFYNCTSCGYATCEAMTKAIFNGLNRPENCHHFSLELLQEEKNQIGEFNKQLGVQINGALSLIERINELVDDLNNKIGSQSASLEESSAAIEEMMASIASTSQVSQKKRASIEVLVGNAAKGRESMGETIRSVQSIAKSVDGIADTIEMIEGVASNTNLLSMNAAIEAAHAGDAGKGFAVVADEIRRLSEATRENSQNISRTLSGIIEGIALTSKRSTETDTLIRQMAAEIGSFADTMSELINTFSELSAGSSEITTALVDLKTLSTEVKDTYGEMMDTAHRLRKNMSDLSEASAKHLAAIV